MIDQTDLESSIGKEMVKYHPVMTGGLHTNKQIFYGKANLVDPIQEPVHSFHGIGKREIFKDSFTIVIQKRRNMFSFCNINSKCPHFCSFPLQFNKAVQLGVTSMEHSLAAKLVQMHTSSSKCNKPASAVFLRGHYLKEEKPNPGSLSAIMAKIAFKGKCHVTP